MSAPLLSLAQDHFVRTPVPETPYDRFMAAFQDVVAHAESPGHLTMDAVEKWTRAASRFRYQAAGDYRWRAPRELDTAGFGDCKDVSLWLFARLREAGAQDLHVVIGKSHLSAAIYHVWLCLRFEGNSYILDPTQSSAVWKSGEFSRIEYMPVYSFDGRQAYAYEPDFLAARH